MEKPINNQVVFITGAASGIGLACACRFAQEGAAVIGFDISESEQWQQVSDITNKQQLITGDVMSLEQQQAAAEEAVDRYGALDVIITSAGIGDAGPVHMVSRCLATVIDINLTGTFLSIKATLPQMMKQRSGSIITGASVEGQQPLKAAALQCIKSRSY